MGLNLDLWQKEILETKGNIVLCSGRQVGKSLIISRRDGEFAVKNAGVSVLIISATERQATELFLKVLNYLEDNYKHMIRGGKDRPTKHIIKLKNNSIIRCLPTGLSGTGIRGFTINRLTADEASFIPDSVWGAVTPMLLTTGGDIALLSTPHGKRGYFYECYNSKDFKTFHVKSEEVIKNRKISPSWTEFQRERAINHLEKEKGRMSSSEYAQEYCGEFIEDLQQFFPDEVIKKCMMMKRPKTFNRNRDYFLGVDVARMGEDECVFAIIDRTDRKNLIHIENIIFKKVYLNEVYNKILNLEERYNFKKIYIDDGGIGVGVFDYLLAEDKTKRKVEAINNRSRPLNRDETHKKKLLKEDLYNNLLGIMERGEIKLLDDDEIFQSFKSIQYEYVKKENQLTKFRIFGSYSHIVEALIRASWCIKDKTLNIWVR